MLCIYRAEGGERCESSPVYLELDGDFVCEKHSHHPQGRYRLVLDEGEGKKEAPSADPCVGDVRNWHKARKCISCNKVLTKAEKLYSDCCPYCGSDVRNGTGFLRTSEKIRRWAENKNGGDWEYKD